MQLQTADTEKIQTRAQDTFSSLLTTKIPVALAIQATFKNKYLNKFL